VTAGAAKGKILRVPDTCRKYRAAKITMSTTTAMEITLSVLFCPGGTTGDT
jgi:hypothetical protein